MHPSIKSQHDRIEYYTELCSVEYTHKIVKIQHTKNYSDLAYNIIENDRNNELLRYKEIQEKYVEIQKNATIYHKKTMAELLGKAVTTKEKEKSCVIS